MTGGSLWVMSVSGIAISCRMLGGWRAPYERALSVSVRSERPSLVRIYLRAPTLEKDAAASLVMLAGLLGRGDPVCAEGAVALPRFAPGNEGAGLIHEAKRDRPDDSI